MPTKHYANAKYMKAPNGVALLNLIRDNASEEYRKRVPVATQDNIQKVGNPILNYEHIMNEFVPAMVNRIAFVMVSSSYYNNPLKEFKEGVIDLGETVEEIFINLIKAEPYYLEALANGEEIMTDAEDLLKRRLPDVKAVFHTRNRQDKYPVTIQYDDLRTAFLSYSGLNQLVSGIVEQLYSSDEYDEFLLMKHLFFEAGLRGDLTISSVTEPTDDASAKAFAKTLRKLARLFTFKSSNYNSMGVLTNTKWGDMVVFMLAEYEAELDVEVLAYAFNMDKADLVGRVIVLDDFGGLEKEGVIAVLADKRWFKVWDNLYTMRTVENGARLYFNYFLHHWQTLSFSPFKNVVALSIKAPTVDSVTITPETASFVEGTGGKIQLAATVTGEGVVSPKVTWYGGSPENGVSVDANGLVTVTPSAPAQSYSINAASVTDPTKTAVATITVTATS